MSHRLRCWLYASYAAIVAVTTGAILAEPDTFKAVLYAVAGSLVGGGGVAGLNEIQEADFKKAAYEFRSGMMQRLDRQERLIDDMYSRIERLQLEQAKLKSRLDASKSTKRQRSHIE